MKSGKTNSWRGRNQPKRDLCPKCGKKGLGPLKVLEGATPVVGQHCRYCVHFKIVKQ